MDSLSQATRAANAALYAPALERYYKAKEVYDALLEANQPLVRQVLQNEFALTNLHESMLDGTTTLEEYDEVYDEWEHNSQALTDIMRDAKDRMEAAHHTVNYYYINYIQVR